MSPHLLWTTLASHSSPHKYQNLPPNIPNPYRLISLICFLIRYTLFSSPIQTSSAIYIQPKLILLSHDHLESLETVHLHMPCICILSQLDKLPDFISRSSLSLFKTNLKTYLFKIYYDLTLFGYALLLRFCLF